MIKFVTVLLFILGLPIILFCQKDSTTSNFNASSISINPDSYTIVVSKIGNKWDNKLGGKYDLDIFNGNKCDITVSIGGFINLHNFSNNQAFSWQLWRGNLGVATSFKFHNVKWLFKSSILSAELSAKHESQHATDVFEYVKKYMSIQPQNFKNGSLRSFEYLQLKTDYMYPFCKNKCKFGLNIGYKYFPKPLLANAPHLLRNSFFLETGIEWKVYNSGFIYAKFYFEQMKNNFVASEESFNSKWEKAPFTYSIAETGIVYTNKKQKLIGVFFSYSNSNGRGLDFIDITSQYSFGLRMDIN